MKTFLMMLCAAIRGGIVSSASYAYVARLSPPSLELRTKALVLLDERNHPAARLGIVDGETVLQFYNRDSSVAAELSVGRDQMSRRPNFFGKEHRNLVGLVSLPNGDSTLYLSDREWEGRVILGAYQIGDIPTNEPAGEWGLVLRGNSLIPPYSVLISRRADGVWVH
jgi:hypothetical protein